MMGGINKTGCGRFVKLGSAPINGTTVLESVARKYGRYTYYKVFNSYNSLVYY